MFDTDTFNKFIQPLKRKIFLLVGRAILTAVNNAEGYMKIQVTSLKDETITDIERAQEYGFETYPKKDAEAFVIFLNGNRDHGIAFCVSDRTYRIKVEEGEVLMYDWQGQKVYMRKDGTMKINDVKGNTIETMTDRVQVNGTNLEVLI